MGALLAAVAVLLCVAAPASAANGSIAGTLSAGGAGIGGSVSVYTTGNSASYVAGGTAAASGAYSISVPPGSYRVYFVPTQPATGGGWQSQYAGGTRNYLDASVITVTDSQTTTVDMNVPAGAAVTGKVSAVDGTGIADAYVSISGVNYSDLISSNTTTAADGTWRIAGIAPGSVRAFFSAAGTYSRYYQNAATFNAAQTITLTAGATRADVNQTLRPGATIQGTIRGDGAAALSGASVSLLDGGEFGSYVGGASSTADGTYKITSIAPGTYTVVVSAPFGSNYRRAVRAGTVTVAEGGTVTGIDQTLVQGGRITGTVRNAAGNPVAGANVGAAPYVFGPGTSGGSTTSASDGTYTISGLSDGDYRVSFSAAGYVNQYFDKQFSYNDAKAVTTGAGQTATSIDASLVAEAKVTGTVTGPAGTGISGVNVEVRATGTSFSTWTTTTGAGGTYSIGGLRAGTYQVRFSGLGYLSRFYPNVAAQASAEVLTLAAGQTRADVNQTMVVGGKITGKVLDDSGAAASGLMVLVDSAGSYQYLSNALTADGTYTISGLETGSYRVAFLKPSFSGGWSSSDPTWFYDGDARALSDAKPIAVTAGETVSGIDITHRRPGKVSGTVTGPGGAVVAWPSVVAYRAGLDGQLNTSTPYSASSTSSGGYEFSSLPAGKYVLYFSGNLADGTPLAPRWSGDAAAPADATQIVVADATNQTSVDAHLTAGGAIGGTVTGPSGPVEDAYIRVTPLDVEVVTGRSGYPDDAGEYLITGLAPGRYRIDAEVYDGIHAPRTLQRTFSVTDGATTDVDVSLLLRAPGGTIQGRVTRSTDQAAAANAVVRAISFEPESGTETYATAYTGSDGRYEFDDLPAGDYYVVAEGGAFRSTYYDGADGTTSLADATALDLAAEATLTADIEAQVGGAITGRVTSASGTGLGYPQVELYDASGYVSSTQGDYTGSFAIRGLEAGSYRLRVFAGYQYLFNGGASSLETAPPIVVAAGATVENQNLQTTSGTTGPTTPPQSLRGSVKFADGTPVPGGYVTAVDVDDSGNTSMGWLDPVGNYSVSVRPGSYRLYAWATSSFSGGTPASFVTRYYPSAKTAAAGTVVAVAANQEKSGLDITVPRAATISGRVTDAAGAGVGSTSVSVLTPEGNYVNAYATTSPQGRYTVGGLEAGSYKVLVSPTADTGLSAQYYANSATVADATAITVGEGQAVTDKNLTLTSAARLSGTVRDGRGDPVAGAAVEVVATGSGYYQRTLRTRVDGTYTASGLPPGSYRLRFLPPATRPDLAAVFAGGALAADDAQIYEVERNSVIPGVDATLPLGGRVVGTVKGGTTALAGARVRAYDADGYSLKTVRTDEAGSYELDGLSPGLITLAFEDPTGQFVGQTHGQTAGKGEATPVAVSATATATVNETLTRGAELSGSVLTVGGRLVTHGYVTLYDADDEYVRSGSVGSRTGRFVMRGVAPGSYRVRFSASGFVGQTFAGASLGAPGTLVTVDSGTKRTDLHARLIPGGTISGTVTSADPDAAVEGLLVHAYDSDGYIVSSTTINPGGSYFLTGLATGNHRVEFTGRYDSTGPQSFVRQFYAGKATLAQATTVAVTAPNETEDIDATLVPVAPAPGGTITGTVRGPAGVLDGAAVRLYDSGRGDTGLSVTTNASGVYTFEDIAAGSYFLRFSAAGHSTQFHSASVTLAAATAITVAADTTTTTDATLAAAPGGLSGGVTGAGGAPVAGAAVSIHPSTASTVASPLKTTTTAGDGTWSVPGLAAGSYKVRITASGYTEQFYKAKSTIGTADPVVVAAGATNALDAITLVAVPGKITGTVTAAGGGALAGASVTAYDAASGASRGSATTAADGTYALGDLVPGSYKVGFSASGRTPAFNGGAATLAAASAIAVASGATVSGVSAQLATPPPTTGSIAGAVTSSAGGGALSGVTVTLYKGTAAQLSVTTAAAGTYRFDALEPASDYHVGFAASGFAARFADAAPTLAAATSITVTAGATRTTDVTLTPLPAKLSGRVVDAGGALAGVTVTPYSATGTAAAGAATTTDADGRFEFTLPAGTYRLGYAKAGYDARFSGDKASLSEATAITVAPGETRTGLDAVLASQTAPGSIAGKVLAPAPLAGATVVVRAVGGAAVATVTTDSAGGWIATTVPPGSYVVDATAPGHDPASLTTPIAVAAGQAVTGVNLTLVPRPASLTGTVTSAGAPLAGATVTAYRSGGDVAGSATTAADGRFAIAVPAGSYRLGAAKAGFVDAFRGAGTLAAATVSTVGAGTTASGLDIELAAVAAPGDPAAPGGGGGDGTGSGAGGGGAGGGGSGGGTGGGSGGGTGGPPQSAKVVAPVVTLPKKPQVDKSGAVKIPVSCPASGTCGGTLTVTYAPKAKGKSKKKPKPVVIGTLELSSANASNAVLKLSAAGKKALKAADGKLKVQVVVTPTGSTTPSSTTVVTLTQAKKKGKKSAVLATVSGA